MFRKRRPAETAEHDAPALPEPSGTPSPVQVIEDASFLELTEEASRSSTLGGLVRSLPLVRAGVRRCAPEPIRFGACDVDANPGVAHLLGIRSIPTLVVFGRDGSKVGRSTGAVSRGDLEATVPQLSPR